MRVALLVVVLAAVTLAAEDKLYDAETIARQVNDAHTTWKATTRHRFAGRTMSHARSLLGYNVAEERMRMKKLGLKHPTDDAPIPESFDVRQQWNDCADVIGNIRDQSSCGSCWAVAAAGTMSDRLCIASQGATKVSISANNLMSCCWTCGFGCEGGFASDAWNYFFQVGLVTGGEYKDGTGCLPYPFPECEHHNNHTTYDPCSGSYDTPQCSRQCQQAYDKAYDDDKHYGASAYRLPADVESIQREIMQLGSVETGYTVYEDFLSYTSGVYQHVTGDVAGGHAVRMIGWGVENGTPYWLIANSWNEDWGDKGYFKILRGADECGIESGVVAGQVKV